MQQLVEAFHSMSDSSLTDSTIAVLDQPASRRCLPHAESDHGMFGMVTALVCRSSFIIQ